MFNSDFYPTPKPIIDKMWHLVDRWRIANILEPSAGKGDILDYIKELSYSHRYDYSAIEKEFELRATLKGKGYKVLDSDFLAYSGLDRFDLIIANPPFSQGEHHLLKALSMMDSGQIVFLLNAETLKNPCTNARKELVNRLDKHKAKIEFIKDAFIDAERKTRVEIALIYIDLGEPSSSGMFDNCTDKTEESDIEQEEETAVASKNTVEFMVEKYNAAINKGTEILIQIDKYCYLFGKAIPLEMSCDGLREQYNRYLSQLRKKYWLTVLDLPEVKKRLTKKEIDEFNKEIELQSNMEFTEKNIREFILSIIGNYEKTLTRAVSDLFDDFTQKYHWHEECAQNVHYFNGWKTNKAFMVNKKIIIPYRQHLGYYGQQLMGYSGKELSWDFRRWLDDIDLVMNYFTYEKDFVSMADAVEQALKEFQNRKIVSTHFTMTIYKKGTMHLVFNNEDTLRRFNITACIGKNWLPEDYGRKAYSDMTAEEKEVVESFEGKESYKRNLGRIGFTKHVLAIENKSA